MISTRDIDDIIGADAVDTDNDRIGKVGQVYLDSESDEPVWVSVKSGLFGTSETLVPLSDANWDRSALHLAFSKDRVKDAPRVEPDAELSPEEQDRLYDYYGLGDGATAGTQTGDVSGTRTDGTGTGTDRGADYDASGAGAAAQGDGTYTDADRGVTYTDATQGADATWTSDDADASRSRGAEIDAAAGAGAAGLQGDRGTQRGEGYDTTGPNTDDAMTRSEERLNVGTQKVQTGRARLRKHIVTEQQSVTVPVSHEEVRVEREPITDANRGDALSGGDLTEEEHEVTLSEERPVVEKETVPVERVRLGTEEVTEQQRVTEDVRHEEIETDGVDEGLRGRDADGTDRV